LNLTTSMTLNDLEPLKKRFLVIFLQFLDAAHISTLNCNEMAGDRPRQPAGAEQRREGGTHQGLQHNYSAQIIVYVAVAHYVSIAQISCLYGHLVCSGPELRCVGLIPVRLVHLALVAALHLELNFVVQMPTCGLCMAMDHWATALRSLIVSLDTRSLIVCSLHSTITQSVIHCRMAKHPIRCRQLFLKIETSFLHDKFFQCFKCRFTVC